MRLSDVSVICRVVNPHTCAINLGVRSVYGLYCPGNKYELIPTVKMETRHPVEGYSGSEFSAICNHCRVMAVWSRKTLNIFEKCLLFGKTPLTVKFSKFCSESSSGHRSTCCVQMSWNLADVKSVKSCVAYLTKRNKISPGSPAFATAHIAPKSCPGLRPTMYSECSRFHPNRFTFRGVIAERVNTAKTRRKVNLIFGRGLSSSQIESHCKVGLTTRRTSGPSQILVPHIYFKPIWLLVNPKIQYMNQKYK